MNDPMLRSVGVLSGLFFDHVIIAEGDTDRAFYSEVNERLLAARDPRGIPHALFLNSGGKDTVPAIVAPLRKLGIPTVGVVDIDIVKEGGVKWARQIAAAGFPLGQHAALQQSRKTVFDTLITAAPPETPKPGEYFKRHGGVKLLPAAERETADNLFDQLDIYGLFVVREGEVEAWLKHLGVPEKSGGWRAAIFTAMGSEPTLANYVQPAADDVWKFIGSISKWLTNPNRRGIPS